MAAETEINPVADRRRRRRRAVALALIPALLASAFFADYMLHGGKESPAAAHQVALARTIAVKASRHGLTLPIGKPNYQGQGGPEDIGPWIDEDGGNAHGWLFDDHKPIDQLASTTFILPGRPGGLPGHGGSGPGGGIGGGPGGGPGGGIVTCVKDGADGGKPSLSAGSTLCTSEQTADEQPQSPIETVTTIVAGPAPAGPTGSGPNTETPSNRDTPETAGPDLPSGPSTPDAPVSAVPEPENWVMMIAGFLLTGVALRGRRAFSKAKARAIRAS